MFAYVLGAVAGGGLLWWYYEATIDNDNSAEGMGADVIEGLDAESVSGELASAIGWP